MPKSVDVLVVNSPLRASSLRLLRSFAQPTLPVNYEPLQAAASLEQSGLEVAFLPLYNIFPYFCPETDTRRAEELLADYEAQVVLFLSSLYLPGVSNPAHPMDLKFGRFLKTRNPNIRVILAGSHASYLPVESLQESGDVDSVALFECEQVLAPLVNCYLSGKDPVDVPGVVYRDVDRRIVSRHFRINIVADLDSLPVPAYHLLRDFQQQITKSSRRMQLLMMTSRGCPYQCAFCASVRYTDNLRCRSGPHIGEELATVKDLYGEKAYFYAIKDNNFTFSPRHVSSVARQFKEHDMKTDLFLTNVTSMTDEIARTAAQFCRFVFYGVETASVPVLRGVTKWHSLDQVIDACHVAKKRGLMTTLNFIIGLPHDTHETISSNLTTMAKLKMTGLADNISPGVLVPYPGTDIFENPGNYGLTIHHYRWEDYEEVGSFPVCSSEFLSRNQIFCYFLTALSMNVFLQRKGLIREDLLGFLKNFIGKRQPDGLASAFTGLMEEVGRGSDEDAPQRYPFERTPAQLLTALPPALSGTSAFVQKDLRQLPAQEADSA